MEKFVDSHAHYYCRQFNSDRDSLIERLLNNSVKYIIQCGTNTESNKRVISDAEQNEKLFAVVGFFPTDVKELQSEDAQKILIEQLKHPKVLALGEIGLDYYHKFDKELEKKMFIQQLKIAKSLDIPICIHSREAEQDTISILKNNGKYKGVIHCFSYGVKAMRELLKLGYYFGVGGTSTYGDRDLVVAIKEMPLDRIVLETDAPYLTPKCCGKERNDSSKIQYVVKEIAKIKGISESEIIRQTNENVKTVYPKLGGFVL